ncbi:MAG: hypothetical protein ACOCY8_03820 [Spirochaetota bacterium]
MAKKLCSWKPRRLKKHRDEYVELVAGATHLCTTCGRVANRKGVLCRPRPFPG